MGRKKTTNRTSPKALQRRLRAKQALDLRLEGKSYPDIAVRLQYSGSGAAFNAIQGLLKHHEMESVDELRKVECSRLDEIMGGLWSRAVTGKKDAVDAVLKIMRRRASLLGLDIPVEVHWKGELEVKHHILLKMGDRPPRLIDLSNFDPDILTEDELAAIRDMPILEAEFREISAPSSGGNGNEKDSRTDT